LNQHILRIWDHSASTRPDFYIANSNSTKKRIANYYGTSSNVIYPPVRNVSMPDIATDTATKSVTTNGKSPFFLIVSRLRRHKNIHIAVKAFNKLKWKLVIIGSGAEYNRLRKSAQDNIEFIENATDDLVQSNLKKCDVFILPQEEDFGIAPIEAMMHGKPILALQKGGALEYVQEGITGEFFHAPVQAVLADGARRIKDKLGKYDREAIIKKALEFGEDRFRNSIRQYVIEKLYEKHPQSIHNYSSV